MELRSEHRVIAWIDVAPDFNPSIAMLNEIGG